MKNLMTSKNICMAALICGVLSIVGCWISGLQGITGTLGILGIVLGMKGRKDAGATAQEQKFATYGFYAGIAGVVLNICAYIYVFVLIGSMM